MDCENKSDKDKCLARRRYGSAGERNRTVIQWAVNTCWYCKAGIEHERAEAATRTKRSPEPHTRSTYRECANECGAFVGNKNTSGYCAACKYDMKVEGVMRVYRRIELNMIVCAVNST